MSFVTAAYTAYSQLKQGQAQKQAADYNAQVYRNESQAALGQSLTQEDLLRRNSRESLGRQLAAFGASGAGYGGSSRIALDTSAINQEMDALNTRYRGTLTAYGYSTGAGIKEQEGDIEQRKGILLAGATLLNAASGKYGNWDRATFNGAQAGG